VNESTARPDFAPAMLAVRLIRRRLWEELEPLATISAQALSARVTLRSSQWIVVR